jgi:Ca2+-binding RTX toxin-like protein
MRRNTSRIFAIALVCAIVASAASAAGSATQNVIFGTNGNDRIAATPAADVIYAKSGDDVVTGVGSGDRVYLSSGNDRVALEPVPVVTDVLLDGNVGHDTFEALGLVDHSAVNGGSGNDVIMLTGCGNAVAGEGGNDTYTNGAACPHAPNSATLGNGNDRVLLLTATGIHLGNGNDRLTTSSPGRLIAGSGNDRVTFVGGGDATVALGSGHDLLALNGSRHVTVSGSNGNDRISIRGGVSHVVAGHSGNDTLEVGNHGMHNELRGGRGRDRARLAGTSSATTCRSIENVVDWARRHRACA